MPHVPVAVERVFLFKQELFFSGKSAIIVLSFYCQKRSTFAIRMNKPIIFLLFIFYFGVSNSQVDSNARSFASTITSYDLKQNLLFVASPSTEGRETGTPGLRRAADYIASQFGLFGIQQVAGSGTYFQSFEYQRNSSRDIVLYDSLNRFVSLKDFYFQPDLKNGLVNHKQVVFMGYGIDDNRYNDYQKDTNLTDKIVIMLYGEPMDKKNYLVSGTAEHSQWYRNLALRLSKLSKYNPAALILIDEEFSTKIKSMEKLLRANASPALLESAHQINFPILFTHQGVAAKLLGIDSLKLLKTMKRISKKHKPIHFFSQNKASLEVDRIACSTSSENVIGFVEGTDLKEEYIVISAHYDHLGKHKGKIYIGADDNGSGTVALIEIAEAFAIAKRAGFAPRRSILFCAFSGEEKGLLGSEYYTKNPLVPLDKTILDLNIDMIGRLDSTYMSLQNPNYIYPIGSEKLSPDLKPILESCNSTYTHLKLDYKFDIDDKNRLYYRSDHYNFAKNNIPVIFFFSGLHADYHKSTDTIDKINFNKMEAITRLVFHIAWKTANQTDRLKTTQK